VSLTEVRGYQFFESVCIPVFPFRTRSDYTHTHTHTHTYNSPMVYQSWEIPPGCELDFHSLMWCF